MSEFIAQSPISTLGSEGVAFSAYPDALRTAVSEAATAWEAFCALPKSIKEAYATDDPQIGVGYECKDGDGVSQDIKENFDFTIRSNGYVARVDSRINNRVAGEFLNAAIRLSSLNRSHIIKLAQHIEKKYHITDFATIMEHSVPFYRFVHYPAGGKPGDVIAEPHTDHSGLTLHLYESTGGCEYLSPTGRDWQPLPVSSDEAVVFGAMQLQLLSGGEIKALSHRVVANETTSACGRYAVICFNLFQGVPTYDRAAHGRLQQMPAGFNYDMDTAQFSQLFRGA